MYAAVPFAAIGPLGDTLQNEFSAVAAPVENSTVTGEPPMATPSIRPETVAFPAAVEVTVIRAMPSGPVVAVVADGVARAETAKSTFTPETGLPFVSVTVAVTVCGVVPSAGTAPAVAVRVEAPGSTAPAAKSTVPAPGTAAPPIVALTVLSPAVVAVIEMEATPAPSLTTIPDPLAPVTEKATRVSGTGLPCASRVTTVAVWVSVPSARRWTGRAPIPPPMPGPRRR